MAKQQVIDSITDAFNAKYQKNGVVYASNIATVNKRDAAGNIVYQQGQSNPLLIIEAIAENITNQSVLKVVNTQFNYYKFPARTNVVFETDFDSGIDPEDFNTEITPTAIPVKYSPVSDQQLVESLGFTTLEFSMVDPPTLTQENKNAFTVTQDVLDLVSKSLTFTGVITTSYNSNNNSRVQFTITEFDSNGEELAQSRDGGFNIPTWYPAGTDDDGKVRKEGTYKTTINLGISKDWVKLGHTYRVMGRTDESNDKRFHTVLANDTYIKITGA